MKKSKDKFLWGTEKGKRAEIKKKRMQMGRMLLSVLLVTAMLSTLLPSALEGKGVRAETEASLQWSAVSLGKNHSAAITTDGDLYCWGNGWFVGNGTIADQRTPVKVLNNVSAVSLGENHSAAITGNGDLYCWGNNLYGQVGNGTTTDQRMPVKVLSNVSAVSLRAYRSAAIITNGDLYCWGCNKYGQVGNGTETSQSTPVKVLSNVSAVSLGDEHNAAITTDGDLYCWGGNEYGQVGNGTTTDQRMPVKVLSNVSAVSLGDEHSAAITENGDLYCWGNNLYGQVGNGTETSQSTPVKVLSNVQSVSLGKNHSAAITINGDLYCWGNNLYGQVGNGTTTTYEQKMPVKVLSNVQSVSLREDHSAAITTDGDLYCWGDNYYGQVGNGTTTTYGQKMPVKVLSNVSAISQGEHHSAAITINGNLYCWGDNDYGQVGNGIDIHQTTPVKVLGDMTSDNDLPIKKNFFTIGIDSNNFSHTLSGFGYNEAKTKCANYSDTSIGTVYPTSLSCYSKLINGLTFKENIALLDVMNGEKWEGSCHGLSMSMALANMGKLNVSSIGEDNAANYSKLSSPADNIELRDLINYYHLMQYVDKIPATARIYNGVMTKLGNLMKYHDTGTWSWDSFWADFFSDVKNATMNDIPLLFGFGYGTEGDGHTVLTCGYDDSSNDDYTIITLYDCNYSSLATKEYYYNKWGKDYGGKYLYLFVSKNEKKFLLSTSKDTLELYNGYATNDNWTYFDYWDMEKMNSIDVGIESKSRKYSSLISGELSMLSDFENKDVADITVFQADMLKPFYLQNSNGRYLKYDGSEYSGNMDIYDLQVVGEHNQTLRFTIDVSDEFLISDIADGCKYSLYMGTNYYTVKSTGADTVKMSEKNGVNISGADYTFSMGLSNEDTGNLLYLSGQSTENLNANYTEDGIKMTTSGKISSIETKSITQDSVTINPVNGSFSDGEFNLDGTIKNINVPIDGSLNTKPNEISDTKPNMDNYEDDIDNRSVPETKAVLKDAKGVIYTVTKSGATDGTVEYTKPNANKEKAVTIPATVTIDGITYKVTSIAANAFKNNKNIRKIVIGKNIDLVGRRAFYGCKRLEKITVKTTTLTDKKVGKQAFKGINKKATIKVPSKKKNVYKILLKKKGLTGKKQKVK